LGSFQNLLLKHLNPSKKVPISTIVEDFSPISVEPTWESDFAGKTVSRGYKCDFVGATSVIL
jgi:hypothetical protein